MVTSDPGWQRFCGVTLRHGGVTAPGTGGKGTYCAPFTSLGSVVRAPLRSALCSRPGWAKQVEQLVDLRGEDEASAGVPAQGTKTSTLRRPRALSLGDRVPAAWVRPHGVLLSGSSSGPRGAQERMNPRPAVSPHVVSTDGRPSLATTGLRELGARLSLLYDLIFLCCKKKD